MRDIEYTVRGFVTVRRNSLRVPLSGSLALHADLDSGLFSGDLVLREATIRRKVLGATLLTVTVQITPESPVIGRMDRDRRMFAAVTVDAVIAARVAGRTLIGGDSCRTTAQAVVPLRSQAGFDLERGGRVAGTYRRPPFTGCGRLTPLVNLLIAGAGNAVVIDLEPRTS